MAAIPEQVMDDLMPRGSLADLKARMGHDSVRAAMIYQHEARGADKTITDAIDMHVQAEQARIAARAEDRQAVRQIAC